METLDETTINRIKNLMNLTDHRGATENEANNASAHVMRLLAKYNLDIAEFDKMTGEQIDQEHLQNEKQSMPVWKTNLLSAIAKAHFCSIYISHGHRWTRHVLVGKPTNVQAVKIVYAFLCDVVNTESQNALKSYNGFEHGKQFCNSFRIGMVTRITHRLQQEAQTIYEEHKIEVLGKEEHTINSPTTSIVVANMYEEAQKEIQDYYKSVGLNLTYGGYSGTNKSGAGYNTGYKAGANVPLHASPSLNRKN